MDFALRVPPGNERGPQYMEQALAGIHQANPRRRPLHLLFGTYEREVSLVVHCPKALLATVQGQLYSHYPDIAFERIPGAAKSDSSKRRWHVDLHLHRDIFPIKRHGQFEDVLNRTLADPLTALLGAVATKPKDALRSRIEIVTRPASRRRQRCAVRILRRLSSPFFRRHHRIAHLYVELACSRHLLLRLEAKALGLLGKERGAEHQPALTTSGTHLHEREEDHQAAADKLGRHLFEAHIRLWVEGNETEDRRAKQNLQEIAGAFGQFNQARLGAFQSSRIRRERFWHRLMRSRSFLLSTEELATLWHPPTATVKHPLLAAVEYRELPPSVALPLPASAPDLAILGRSAFRGQGRRFGILPDDRRRHLAILGKTGMGKSTLLSHLIGSDILGGRGVGLIDPHGDLCEEVLRRVPKHRTNDIVLFDAGDVLHPVAFNPLRCPRPEQRTLIASGILSAFKKLYAEFWGPRLEHILRNSLLALLETPGATLLTLARLLHDVRFRQDIVRNVSDPMVQNFWQKEFASFPVKLQAEALSPIQNKIGHFVSNPLLRNILGQAGRNLDLRNILDSGKVLLCNVSKGRLGEDASALLGSLLVSSLQIAAMGRAEIPEAERRDFFLYVDEFQNFATESFATILSEARKYRLSLTIANQYLAQLEEETRAAVFGNVGTLVAFQVGADDAEAIALQLGPEVTTEDVLRLPKYTAYVRLLIDGMPSRPFSMQTLAPSREHRDRDRAAIIRRVAHKRYAKPKAHVESAIREVLTG